MPDRFILLGIAGMIPSPVLPLGRVIVYETAARLCMKHDINPLDLLRRHALGDHGSLDDEDVLTNETQIQSLRHDPDAATFILSSYPLGDKATRGSGDRVWIITRTGWMLEDGPFTEILLPEDR